MLERIKTCQKCELRGYQAPLLDYPKKHAVIVVGLSAKVITRTLEIPLDNRTKSGQLVLDMERISAQHSLTLYRTNLVKCPPLNECRKLRYPNQTEINLCFENILYEINELDPRIIVLCGKIVQVEFEKRFGLNIGLPKDCIFPYQQSDGRYYVASYHPSYIMRSKERKKRYLENFEEFLKIYTEREKAVNEFSTEH